jgi:hypothetical protein
VLPQADIALVGASMAQRQWDLFGPAPRGVGPPLAVQRPALACKATAKPPAPEFRRSVMQVGGPPGCLCGELSLIPAFVALVCRYRYMQARCSLCAGAALWVTLSRLAGRCRCKPLPHPSRSLPQPPG